jgi:hypothetical protein
MEPATARTELAPMAILSGTWDLLRNYCTGRCAREALMTRRIVTHSDLENH